MIENEEMVMRMMPLIVDTLEQLRLGFSHLTEAAVAHSTASKLMYAEVQEMHAAVKNLQARVARLEEPKP